MVIMVNASTQGVYCNKVTGAQCQQPCLPSISKAFHLYSNICLAPQCNCLCRGREASDVAREMWGGIKEFVCFEYLANEPPLPQPFTLDDHVDAAIKFRTELKACCEKTVCAVCSRYRPKVDATSHAICDIPNLSLLDASLPKTDEYPRDALTTFQWRDTTYCLQEKACHVGDDPNTCNVTVCKECFFALKTKRVPPMSLVRFDAGKNKIVNGYCLVGLTHIVDTHC
jgi:hypothetical protein